MRLVLRAHARPRHFPALVRMPLDYVLSLLDVWAWAVTLHVGPKVCLLSLVVHVLMMFLFLPMCLLKRSLPILMTQLFLSSKRLVRIMAYIACGASCFARPVRGARDGSPRCIP